MREVLAIYERPDERDAPDLSGCCLWATGAMHSFQLNAATSSPPSILSIQLSCLKIRLACSVSETAAVKSEVHDR
jgi:hypothetical protein